MVSGLRQSDVMAQMAETAQPRRPAMPHRHISRVSARSISSVFAPDSEVASPRIAAPLPERPHVTFLEPYAVRTKQHKLSLWKRFQLWSNRVLCGGD